jgi:predicted MFS family arabinose efflux permease
MAGHSAGAMDVRNVIGSLLLVYGVILTIMGLVGDKALDKTGNINANLIAGIALLVVGGIFAAWARLKPIVIPDDYVPDPDARPHH